MSRNIKLVIGNKRYSSWSLRPWLILKHAEVSFEEIDVILRTPETKANILQYSPSGLVPALIVDRETIWDSLAIAEYVSEIAAGPPLWPKDSIARAVARSISAEMHSGFSSLRSQMPMDIPAIIDGVQPTDETLADIDRIQRIWQNCRERFGKASDGPFLFGNWSIADAMYAPVVTRFRTYGIDGDKTVSKYMQAVLEDPFFREWEAGC